MHIIKAVLHHFLDNQAFRPPHEVVFGEPIPQSLLFLSEFVVILHVFLRSVNVVVLLSFSYMGSFSFNIILQTVFISRIYFTLIFYLQLRCYRTLSSILSYLLWMTF
jgi:hypothetical protein